MLYIRTDANKDIAAGHVMRCIAIANSLRSFGEDSIFITSETDAVNMISENGFQYILMDGKWNDLDYEINSLKSIIEENNVKKLLIDSYYITHKYLKSIPEEVSIIYLGSLMKRLDRLNLLVNYSNVYDDIFYKNNYRNRGVQTLLGENYAPLRKEFQSLKPIYNSVVKSILITTGSTDKDNVTLKIIEYLLRDKLFRKIQMHVVIGRLNNNYNQINNLKSKFNNIFLHLNVKGMANLIRRNQLVVSASGTTLYELCACGVPSVSFSLVKEQEKEGLKFDLDGVVPYAGSFADCNNTENVLSRIKKLLVEYIENPEVRIRKAIKMNKYIDGNGSTRIAEEIFCLDRS